MSGGDIDQILIAELLDKIGHKDELAGATTVFQNLLKMNSLLGVANPGAGDLTTVFRALKLISDYVDTLEAKIGLNTDAAGTTTLFARAAQIAGFVDSVETSLATIAGYTDTLETKIGLNTDAPGTSTLFARLAQLANSVTAIKSIQTGYGTVTANTESASVNVTISAVNTAKTIVIPNGAFFSPSSSSNVDQCFAILLNGTTVQVGAHCTSGSPSIKIYFTVVEFC